MKCIFDTNAFLMPFQFGINPYQGVKDLLPGVELVTLEDCVQELKGLKPIKWESIINLGLKNGLKIVKSRIRDLKVDDIIVEYAKQEQAIVITQDRELKKKLLNESLRLVVMRKQKKFELIG